MKPAFLLLLVITNSATFIMCYFTLFFASDGGDQKVRVGKLVSVPTDPVLPKTPQALSQAPLPDPAAVERILLPCNSHHKLATPAPISSNQLITCHKLSNATSHLPTIVAITPTYKRLTQKLDLVSLCNTIMHVPGFLWIVIEDSKVRTSLVANVLQHCKVSSIHLNIGTSRETKKAGQRGVEQRNAGLDWARKYCKEHCNSNCSGVIYFMDDDNKYDLRLFHEMRKTETVSVFPVAFSGGLAFEGPICKDGKAIDWQAVWQSKLRHVPVDMAAFAIHINLFIKQPEVRVGYRPGQKKRSKRGFMESDLIKSIGRSREQIECRGAPGEVLVWHVKTTKPFLSYKNKYPNVEV